MAKKMTMKQYEGSKMDMKADKKELKAVNSKAKTPMKKMGSKKGY